MKPVRYGPRDVSDKVLSTIELAGEKLALKDHLMRVRQLEVQPGGIVPWHSHAERPAPDLLVACKIVENASNCQVPIVHKADDVVRETHATSHWRQNHGLATVVLLSFDIAADPDDHHM